MQDAVLQNQRSREKRTQEINIGKKKLKAKMNRSRTVPTISCSLLPE
jgi:hypothetical protein